MDWTPEQLAKARALLAEDSAILVQKQTVAYAAGAQDAAGRRRQKIVRQWPKISDGDRALCDAYLREYASADNDAPGRIVHGPKADRETYAGDWRMTRTDLSRLKTDPREQGVYQTLVFPADASDGPDGAFPSEETHLNHVHSVVSTGDAPAELDCAVPPPRTRLSVNARLDRETGEWESEKRTDMARGKRWTYTDGDALATTTHTREEHADAPPTVPAPVPGKIVRADADFDEYGTYRTRVDETTAHEKSTGPYTASQTALQSTTEESVRNAQKAPSAGDNEAVSAHVNEFGLVDYNKRKTTPKSKTISYTSQNSALESTTTESGRNAEQAPNAGDNEAVSAHINELGKVDYDKRSITPKAKTISYTSQNTELESTTTESGRNADQAPNAGDNEAVSAHINELGKVDYDKRSTTPKAKTISYTSQNTELESTTTESGRNADQAPNAGDNEAVSAHINELGKVDYEKRSTTPKAKTISYTSAQNPARTITTEIGRNADSPPTAGEHETATARINELGKVDYEKHVTCPKEVSTSFISEKNAEREVTTEIGINAKRVPGIGKNERITAHYNEHGLLDFTKHTLTEKGGLQNGGSYTYVASDGYGIKKSTTITWRTGPRKGEQRSYAVYGHWTIQHVVTINKHDSYASACAALSGKTNVVSAHVTNGGTGVWYSHLTTWKRTWD